MHNIPVPEDVNGWPDPTSWLLWAQLFIAHLKRYEITKALLFVDNAEVHCLLCMLEILINAGVRVVGFIPNASGLQQPCNVEGLGKTKPLTERRVRDAVVLLHQNNFAKSYERACRHLELAPAALEAGGSIIAGGFKKTGLLP